VGGGRGRLAGPEGRMGRLAVMPIGQKLKEILFRNRNWIFEYTKTLEICTWRFRRDLLWGFFLISSRLLKDFRKIKYAMPCHAMHPMQDHF
jgi:hypothetical protein